MSLFDLFGSNFGAEFHFGESLAETNDGLKLTYGDGNGVGIIALFLLGDLTISDVETLQLFSCIRCQSRFDFISCVTDVLFHQVERYRILIKFLRHYLPLMQSQHVICDSRIILCCIYVSNDKDTVESR